MKFILVALSSLAIIPIAYGQTGTVYFGPPTTANIGIGTVSTGVAGTSVGVTNSGSGSNATFNFTIPQGSDGTSNFPNLNLIVPAGSQKIGTTYYVSSRNGSDSNNGTSPATPFATIPKACTVHNGGDRILLDRGSIFSLTSTCALKSGPSSSQRTILGVYGDARLPMPIVDGATAVTGTWSANSTYPNVYQLANTATLGKMFVDSQIQEAAPLLPITYRGQWCRRSMGSYASGTTFDIYQSVTYNSNTYVSLVTNNTGNQPDTNPSKWAAIPTNANGACTYAVGDVVTYTSPSLSTTLAYIAPLPSQYSDNNWHYPADHTTDPYTTYDNLGYWTALPNVGGSPANSTLAALSVAPGHAYSDGTNWYAVLYDSSLPSAHVLEANTSSSATNLIGGGNIGHVIVRGLQVERCYASCISFFQSNSDGNGTNVQTQDITVEDNKVFNGGVPGGGNNSEIYIHGYSPQKVTTTATWSSGSTTLTTAATTGMSSGQYIFGAGIPAGTKITAVSGTSVTISAATTAAGSGSEIAAASWTAANLGYNIALNVHFLPWQAPGGECPSGCSNLDADPQYGIPGIVIQRNDVGRMDVNPSLRYHSSGISVEGTVDFTVLSNTVHTVNAMGISGDAYYFGSGNVRGMIAYNEVYNSEGGIQNNYSTGEDSPGSRYTTGPSRTLSGTMLLGNYVHDIRGFAIGNGTSVNWDNFFNRLYNNQASSDRKLYNAEDCNGAIPFLTAGQNRGGRFIGNDINGWASSALTLEAAGQSCSNTLISGNRIQATGNNRTFLNLPPAARNSTTQTYPDEVFYFASGTTPTFGPNDILGGPYTDFRVNFTNSGDDSFRQTFSQFLSAYPSAGTLIASSYIGMGGGSSSGGGAWPWTGCTAPALPSGSGGPWMLSTYGASNTSSCPSWTNINNFVVQGEENIDSTATSLFSLARIHNVSLASGGNWTGWTWTTPVADAQTLLASECLYLKQPASGTASAVVFPSNVVAPALPAMTVGNQYGACFNFSLASAKWIAASNWVAMPLP